MVTAHIDSIIDRVVQLFECKGSAAYLGEPVTQLEHALQAATLAEQESASPDLIAAALLHDVGHLLDADAADPASMDHDLAHEHTGARWLSRHFSPAVVEPVKLHVPAKRLLCAIDPDYLARLSPASIASLRLQRGPMSAEEVEAFRRHEHGAAAVRLRRWDDAAKVPGLATPPIGQFLGYLELASKSM